MSPSRYMAPSGSNKGISSNISIARCVRRGSTKELRRFSEKSSRETCFGQATNQTKSDANRARAGPVDGEVPANDVGRATGLNRDEVGVITDDAVYADHDVL